MEQGSRQPPPFLSFLSHLLRNPYPRKARVRRSSSHSCSPASGGCKFCTVYLLPGARFGWAVGAAVVAVVGQRSNSTSLPPAKQQTNTCYRKCKFGRSSRSLLSSGNVEKCANFERDAQKDPFHPEMGGILLVALIGYSTSLKPQPREPGG